MKLEKERRWKSNLRSREMILLKKIRIVCFAHEVITNGVSCRWFYGIIEGVGDFVQLIYQKIRLD